MAVVMEAASRIAYMGSFGVDGSIVSLRSQTALHKTMSEVFATVASATLNLWIVRPHAKC